MNEREVILEAIQSFAIAYNAGDLPAVLASYDDDLVKMRHGAEPESKADTARRVEDVFARFETKVEVSNVELEVNGDMAFTRGTFLVTLAPRGGGETQRVARRYLEIWRKRAGRWRVARTMDDVGDA